MNLNKKDKRNIEIVIAVIVILLLIWFFCGFGGPHPWAVDLNDALGASACPASCWLQNDSNGGGGGGGNTPSPSPTSCPPLYSKMDGADHALINAGITACLANGGRSTTTDYEVSCRDDLGRIDCDALSADPNNARFAYLCHVEGGNYKCQDNFLGCYCPGTNPLPAPKECGKTLTWSQTATWTAECHGPCDQGTCIEDNGYCQCSQPDQGATPCSQESATSCSAGECPQGEECISNIAMTSCYCATPL